MSRAVARDCRQFIKLDARQLAMVHKLSLCLWQISMTFVETVSEVIQNYVTISRSVHQRIVNAHKSCLTS